ncbi:MAG TPA: glycosyltransferase family 4 protein [Gemmatimonadaceae bacterium]|nr:glycosyltransferase family 4 protein [Gemmatimonadaceae bacterium]
MVEANCDGTVGGSYQVLFDIATRIDRNRFEPVVLFYEDNIFATRLRERGIEVILFDEIARKERQKLAPSRTLTKLVGFGAAILRRRNELRRLNIDILHLNNAPSIGSDDWLPAARLARIPCVVSVMGFGGRPRRRIHRWLYRQFDLYLPVSRYMADVVRNQGVDPRRIELVYVGVDFDQFRARVRRSRDAVRTELGVLPAQLLVMMVGNIRAWKGQREVVAALRLLPETIRTRLRVFFAGATAPGDAEYETKLKDDIASAGLSECVTLLGPRGDVPDLYNAADIALHASTTPEPFGLVVPEAMSLNCAVIAASTGGPAEIIAPGTGILCDPTRPEEYAGALKQLVENDWLRQAMSDAAPARAANFSVDRTIEGTEQVYERALRRASTGRSRERAVDLRA